MSTTDPIVIQLGQEEFPTHESAENAKILTEGNQQLIRNYMAQVMTDMCNLSFADLGELKYLELRARYQGEISAMNYLLNIHNEAISAKSSD